VLGRRVGRVAGVLQQRSEEGGKPHRSGSRRPSGASLPVGRTPRPAAGWCATLRTGSGEMPVALPPLLRPTGSTLGDRRPS
jgi:hypothetical protein